MRWIFSFILQLPQLGKNVLNSCIVTFVNLQNGSLKCLYMAHPTDNPSPAHGKLTTCWTHFLFPYLEHRDFVIVNIHKWLSSGM